jgi:hypothetical protein
MHFDALYERLSRGDAPPVSAGDGRAVLQLLHDIWIEAGIASEPDRRQACA